MKKLLLRKLNGAIFTASLLVVSFLNAQTDVTSTYLSNANFNSNPNYFSTDAVDLPTATDGSSILTVQDWGDGINSGWGASATFEYGGANLLNGIDVPLVGPSSESGSGEAAIGINVAWGGQTVYMQPATLPAGEYKLKYKYYNANTAATGGTSLVGWVPNTGASTLSTVTSFDNTSGWVEDTVSFTISIETPGNIQIGVLAINSGSSANSRVFIDDVTLIYTAPTQSVDDTLSALTTSVGTLSPAFSPTVYEYFLMVPASTASVDLTATKNDALATVSGGGTISLAGGDTVADIVVTAEAGNSKTYSVKITENYIFNQSFDLNPNYLFSATDNLAPANSGSNLDVYGWDLDAFGFSSSATFEYGTAQTMNTRSVPSTDADGGFTGAALGIMSAWNGYVKYSQPVTLPAGTYKISYKAYNASADGAVGNSLVGWVPDSGTEELSTISGGFTSNTWVYDEITFTLAAETSGKIQVGMEASANSGSGDKAHVYFDHLAIEETTLGVKGFDADVTFKFGPNPTRGIVKLSASSEISEVSFYNIIGQHKQTFKNLGKKKDLDISNFSSGIYFMKVNINNQFKTVKVILE